MMNKETLLEDTAVYIAKLFNYPPLTSTIYAWLLLDIAKKGTTFKELQDVTKASKSSISNSLQVLTQNNHVEYITKLGERTRYYRLSHKFVLQRIKRTIDNLQTEKNLMEDFRNSILLKDINCDEIMKQKSNIYIEHIEKNIELLKDTLEKLESVS